MSSAFCSKSYRCKNKDWCAKDYNPKLDDHECFEPMTNADRIRQMSDGELASYLTGVWWGFEETPGMCDVCNKVSIQNCSECWLDWLKQEAEGDGLLQKL